MFQYELENYFTQFYLSQICFGKFSLENKNRYHVFGWRWAQACSGIGGNIFYKNNQNFTIFPIDILHAWTSKKLHCLSVVVYCRHMYLHCLIIGLSQSPRQRTFQHREIPSPSILDRSRVKTRRNMGGKWCIHWFIIIVEPISETVDHFILGRKFIQNIHAKITAFRCHLICK